MYSHSGEPLDIKHIVTSYEESARRFAIDNLITDQRKALFKKLYACALTALDQQNA